MIRTRHSTGEPAPEAWGGYHDAGDWNPRRVTHMRTTLAQLELLELFPNYSRALDWPLPRSIKGPAVLEEALFELDLFRRLQRPDGGVPLGIETPGDPIEGEVSWLQSMAAYVFAPDVDSTFLYAAVAGRAAKLLLATDPQPTATYRESALRAMTWAEAEWAQHKAAAKPFRDEWRYRDDRNLASVCVYDLTGDAHWHEVFRQDTCPMDPQADLFVWPVRSQGDAAFAYCLLPPTLSDPALHATAVSAFERRARASLDYAAGNAYNLTSADRGKPMFNAFYSTPGGVDLARAHRLTGRPEYLAGALAACQFSAGCNPNNLVYTSGLGANPMRHPLHVDSRLSGQPGRLA